MQTRIGPKKCTDRRIFEPHSPRPITAILDKNSVYILTFVTILLTSQVLVTRKQRPSESSRDKKGS